MTTVEYLTGVPVDPGTIEDTLSEREELNNMKSEAVAEFTALTRELSAASERMANEGIVKPGKDLELIDRWYQSFEEMRDYIPDSIKTLMDKAINHRIVATLSSIKMAATYGADDPDYAKALKKDVGKRFELVSVLTELACLDPEGTHPDLALTAAKICRILGMEIEIHDQEQAAFNSEVVVPLWSLVTEEVIWNAYKYGANRVAVWVQSGNVCFGDNGRGISLEDELRLKTVGRLDPSKEGFGIGLGLMKEAVGEDNFRLRTPTDEEKEKYGVKAVAQIRIH